MLCIRKRGVAKLICCLALCDFCKGGFAWSGIRDIELIRVWFDFMLRGEELLEKLKELSAASNKDLARACGYVSRRGDGMERVNLNAFYSALLDAKGVKFAGAGASCGRYGRKARYKTKVHFNGNLMVGKTYLSMLNFRPGDRFEIKLSPSQIQLVLLEMADD